MNPYVFSHGSSTETLPSEYKVNKPTLYASSTTSFEDLAHEIRQPLSVIESLAYYLELTCTDERACAHLRRIQAMVREANGILTGSRAAHAAVGE